MYKRNFKIHLFTQLLVILLNYLKVYVIIKIYLIRRGRVRSDKLGSIFIFRFYVKE